MSWTCIQCAAINFEDDDIFCDSCHAPRRGFLETAPPETISQGSLLGHLKDGTPCKIPFDNIHYLFCGKTKKGKTRAAMNVAVQFENNGGFLLVIDPEGEWKKIIPKMKKKTEYYLSLRNLKINPFDLKDKGLIKLLIKETIFRKGRFDLYDFTPQMERVLDECIEMSNSIPNLIETIRNLSPDQLRTKTINLKATIAALLNRLGDLAENDTLRQIFYCEKSNIDLFHMSDKNVFIDLSDLDAKVAYSRPLQLIYNVIVIAGLIEALNKPITDTIKVMVVAEEAQRLVPTIFNKDTATDTWVATEYTVRLRKRGYVMVIITQHPKNIESDIVDNVHVTVAFSMQSKENIEIMAGIMGYSSHYVRRGHIERELKNLDFREAIVAIDGVKWPFKIMTSDFSIDNVSLESLEGYMPLVDQLQESVEALEDDESRFLETIRQYPFMPVVERKSMLGWKDERYTDVVASLVRKGTITKESIRLGVGRPRIIYQIASEPHVPSLRHEFYVNHLLQELTSQGFVCRASKVGPDIQIPDKRIAINVELGSSAMVANWIKASKDFDIIVICSDAIEVLEALKPKIEAGNVLFALIWEVPDLFRKNGFNFDKNNI